MVKDLTCYVGCQPKTTLTTLPAKVPSNIHVTHPLAMTGASIELMVIVAIVMVFAGVALVRRKLA